MQCWGSAISQASLVLNNYGMRELKLAEGASISFATEGATSTYSLDAAVFMSISQSQSDVAG